MAAAPRFDAVRRPEVATGDRLDESTLAGST